jgi:hypothetical protein
VVAVNGRAERDLVVTNLGGATASSIAARALAAPFRYKDGAYPGTGGTCGATCSRGTSCRLVVAFERPRGRLLPSLALDYDDGAGGHPSALVACWERHHAALLVIATGRARRRGDFGRPSTSRPGARSSTPFYVRNLARRRPPR